MYPTVKDEQEAYVLANLYGFSPARFFKRHGKTDFSYGKYEPDHNPGTETRCMLIAHNGDKTNVLFLYTPGDFPVP